MNAETWQTATLGDFFTLRHAHVLTTGRYVGAEDIEDDREPLGEKMQRLVGQSSEQFAESRKLEKAIRSNLEGFAHGG